MEAEPLEADGEVAGAMVVVVMEVVAVAEATAIVAEDTVSVCKITDHIVAVTYVEIHGRA
jgi:hypothetical protein